MDMSGTGIVTRKAFVNSLPCKRLIIDFNRRCKDYKIGLREIEEYAAISGLFDEEAKIDPRTQKNTPAGINF